MQCTNSRITKVETSTFLHHVPEDAYIKALWFKDRVYVNPKTYAKIKDLRGDELAAYLRTLKEFKPG